MNHRSVVGPGEFWDILGAQMLQVMVDQGLRKEHTLLDVGCGSLRGGRFLVQYLEPGRYYGIEPSTYLINSAIEHEIGDDMVVLKRPSFSNDDRFTLTRWGVRFDYILAQSIISHTSLKQTKRLLEQTALALNPNGIACFTYFRGSEDTNAEEWTSPGHVYWRANTLERMCCEAGLLLRENLNYKHPAGQTWIKITRR